MPICKDWGRILKKDKQSKTNNIMYKEVLRSIEDIETMPLISLIVFMFFFIGMFIWVIRVDKKYIEHMEALPFNDEDTTKDHEKE